MCGICGVWTQTSRHDLRDVVGRMTRSIAHRGPNAQDVFVGAGVALGHARLAIIDLSPAGAQPMTLGSTTVVYNGESYNFQELRKELEATGRTFRGHSDTEVLLNAYDAWGLDGLARLEGIFAFALWDAARHRLVLMRDRLGIKPLFYARRGEELAFGSEIKAVLAGMSVERALDEQALSEYLWYGNAFEERTMFRGVRALQPGHRLVAEGGSIRIEPWWRIENWLERPAQYSDSAEAAAAVRQAVDAAVSRQLVSDVPVGIFLSGGVDSSAIAASAAASGQRLKSFSVGFDFERGVNELPKARSVAELFGFEHHEMLVRGADLPEVIHDLVRSHDEPFADAANIPLFLLARELNGSVKVVLQGDGGDEMFAGYRRYALLRNTAMWQLWPGVLSVFLKALPGDTGLRIGRLGMALGHREFALRMALLLTTETLSDPPTALLEADARAELERATDPFLAYRNCARRFADQDDPVQRMLLTDLTLQLPSQFLPKVDRATMACGLEARVPLLDERVGELAVGMPARFKARGTEKKIVLRDAMRGRLPAQILDGPKTGFGVPYQHWLRTSLHEFARSHLLKPAFIGRFRLRANRVRDALDEHRAGKRDRGFVLWKLLQLALWADTFA